MVKRLLLAAVLVLQGSVAATAQDRVTLGWGRMFTNDAIGDGKDRWLSGTYSVSRLRGPAWNGVLPEMPGEVLELRGFSAIIAPSSLALPAVQDRRYAGILSFGVHTHFAWAGNEVALGGDLVLTGPQNGVGRFQKWTHNMLGLQEPLVLEDQIGNAVYPSLVAEVGRAISLGGLGQVRPFVEVRAGLETMVRVGGDLTLGRFGKDALLLRDPATGQRYRGIEGARDKGLSLTLGGDLARVFDSALLPAGEAATMSEERLRLRAGLQWQGERASTFYGVTYLSPEFDEQPEGQVVGALSLALRF